MTIEELIKKTPAFLSVDQCDIVDTSSFPKTYYNESGKRIRIESYFNGSIATYQNKIYFCCRADQRPWFHNIRLVLCELDDDFNVKKGTARFVNVGSLLDSKGKNGEFRVEDPRLFTCGGKLHLSYGDGYQMYHATFTDDIQIDRWKSIANFRVKIGENDYREKNWTPFDYEGKPHFIYADSPRVIWCPFTRMAHLSEQRLTWKYGQIRGGTPAIPYKDKYITFFHSAENVNQSWQNGRLYAMGAYLFNREPPFKVTAITPTPLMRGELLYKNPIVERQAVIFPAGLIQSKDSFFVSMGINDSCTGVIRIQKFLVDSSLVQLKA